MDCSGLTMVNNDENHGQGYVVGGFSPYPSEKSWSESQLGS